MAYFLYEDNNDKYGLILDYVDKEPSEIELIDDSKDGGTRINRFNSYTKGRSVKPETVMKNLMIGGRKRKLRGILQTFSKIFAVTDEFRKIVEELEPGVHQFLPVDLIWRDETLAEKRYLLFVGQRLDTTHKEKTTMKWRDFFWDIHAESEVESDPSLDKIVLSSDAIGSSHLWYDKHLISMPIVSEVLGERLRSSRITGIGLKPIAEA